MNINATSSVLSSSTWSKTSSTTGNGSGFQDILEQAGIASTDGSTTGTGISPLQSVTAQSLIEMSQSVTGQDQTLPSVFQHEMQDIADDPAYADQMAQLMSQATHWATKEGPDSMVPMDQVNQQPNQKMIDSLQPQLTALYNTDKAEGKSGAETVSDLLKLQLSQPQSYWNAVDPDHLLSNDSKGFAQAELNTLQAGMTANAATQQDQ